MSAKILIVHDSPDLFGNIKKHLTQIDYQHSLLMKPRLLFSALMKKNFDLILLGINLQKMNGLNLLQQLKRHTDFQDIPVIMFSEKMDDQLMVQSLEYGAVDFICDPISKIVLKARIKAAVASKEYEKYLERRVEARITKLQNTIKAYERFVPQEFLKYLNKKKITDVQLGHHIQQEMSILFADIRSFTSISEKLTPEENFKLLNSYLSCTGPVVRKNNGFIDKYIGDTIMALFDMGADDAVRAGVEILHTLAEYNQGRKKDGQLPLKIGIGINTGELMLGTIGEHNRMEGTVISDSVNLASRLEGLTKIYGSSILISEYTYNNLKDPTNYTIRLIDQVRVKGKSKAIIIYAVMDGEPPEILEKKLATGKIFEQARHLFQIQKLDEAELLFKQCLDKDPADKASQVYLNRCQHFLKIGHDENWDGITDLETK